MRAMLQLLRDLERGGALLSGTAGARRRMLLSGLVAEALGTCAGVKRAAGSDAARRGTARAGYGAVPGIDADALADALLPQTLPHFAASRAYDSDSD